MYLRNQAIKPIRFPNKTLNSQKGRQDMKSVQEINAFFKNPEKRFPNKVTEVQKMTLYKCLRCRLQPTKSYRMNVYTTHMCSCGSVYWSLNKCPKCEKPGVTMLYQKPKAGQLVQCDNCSYAFHAFECPKQNCGNFFWAQPGKYRSGDPIQCNKCQSKFKLVVCVCGGQVYRMIEDQVTEGITTFDCPACKKQFVFTICPGCNKPDYYPEPLEIGDRIKCSNCLKKRVFVPCTKCKRSLDTLKFSFCEPIKCDHCQNFFQFSKCPMGCGINYYENADIPGPMKICRSSQCEGKRYLVINCKKCSESVYIDEFQPGIAREEFCPHCKDILRFYICHKCFQINTKDKVCIEASCPPPVQLVSSIKSSEGQLNSQLDSLNQDYQQKECKLCCEKDSVMINTKCWHVMMCQDCFGDYKKKSPHPSVNDVLPCPVCKILGPYVEFKKPRYC